MWLLADTFQEGSLFVCAWWWCHPGFPSITDIVRMACMWLVCPIQLCHGFIWAFIFRTSSKHQKREHRNGNWKYVKMFWWPYQCPATFWVIRRNMFTSYGQLDQTSWMRVVIFVPSRALSKRLCYAAASSYCYLLLDLALFNTKHWCLSLSAKLATLQMS